jgi:hypothetical protein
MDALAQEEGAVPSAPAAGRSRDPELRVCPDQDSSPRPPYLHFNISRRARERHRE